MKDAKEILWWASGAFLATTLFYFIVVGDATTPIATQVKQTLLALSATITLHLAGRFIISVVQALIATPPSSPR
jgi:hypothetical protein